MERLGLVLLLAQLAALATHANAGTAVLPLYRSKSSLDPNAQRSSHNVVYYGEFLLGTPPKQFTGCFDTGSSDTWLPSVGCMDPACTSHDRFNSRDSSTFKSSAASVSTRNIFQQRANSWGPFMVVYGTGQVAGTVAADTLQLGNITVQNQGFGLVLSSSSDFVDISCDGLFGLAFPAISNLQTTPAFFNMLNDGSLDAPLFSLYMNPDPSKDPAGELAFGVINPSHYTGKISYAPVTTKKYWTVALDGVGINGSPVAVAATSVVIDSGTSAILLGPDDSQAIHSAIPGVKFDRSTGYWTVVGGCAAVSSLPAVTFTIGGASLDLQPQQWTRPAESESSTDYSGACVSAMIGSGQSANTILGAPFLRGFFSVYQYDSGSKIAQVGFAPSAAS